MEEVEYAVRNNGGKKYPNGNSYQQNIYKWFSKDWKIEINFVLVDWDIKTFYPFINK